MVELVDTADLKSADFGRGGSSPPTRTKGTTMFDERKLYEEIVRIWGAYGAHAEVFKMIYMKANPGPPPDWLK